MLQNPLTRAFFGHCSGRVLELFRRATLSASLETDFPVGQASALFISWNDTTSGRVIQSDINWGPANGPMQALSKARNGADYGNTFSVLNLLPNSPYVFSVRDEDLITRTQFGEPLTITTQPTDLIDILLQTEGGQPRVIGKAQLTSTGSFTCNVFIPPDTPSGSYGLSAALSANILASTSIKVIGAAEQIPADIQVIDPATNISVISAVEGSTFTLRGEGFQPGAVNVSVDTVTGQALGTTPSDSAGNFQANFVWPVGVLGDHNVMAEQVVGGQTFQASWNLFVQQIPR